MSARYGVIDVANLGEMDAIVPTDDEALLKRRLASFKARWSASDPPMGAAFDVETIEFDPAVVVMEVGTNYQTNLEARINQAARDTTLAFAYGSNLDAIATRYPGGVPRLNKGLPNEESDDRYRRRIWLAANAFTTAGAEEAYVFHALTACAELRDATATVERTREGPVVIVTCLAEGPNPDPTLEQLLQVRKRLHEPGIKPLTDVINVTGPHFIDMRYQADVYLLPGPDASLAMTALEASLAVYLEAQNWLGADHTEIGRMGALSRAEVHSVAFLSPRGDVFASPRQVVRVIGKPVLTLKGRRS